VAAKVGPVVVVAVVVAVVAVVWRWGGGGGSGGGGEEGKLEGQPGVSSRKEVSGVRARRRACVGRLGFCGAAVGECSFSPTDLRVAVLTTSLSA
jgi:hypothetical protein